MRALQDLPVVEALSPFLRYKGRSPIAIEVPLPNMGRCVPGRPEHLRQRNLAAGQPLGRIQTGKVAVNLDAKTVEADGRAVHLTGKEYQMLELLSLRKGTTLTKEMFLNHLYGGMDEPELKIIDVFICKLRKKLSEATEGDNYIETVWGRGYVLRDPEPVAPSQKLAMGA